MAETSVRHLALLVTAAIALSGCENAGNPFAGIDKPAPEPVTSEAAKSVRTVGKDIESPETFQTTDSALWDGRPSLGGVWVASPDAVNPERVIMRNEANGKFVIGALFRRERDNPGPKLQISSDAADALGMLAGQPGKLNVTALRRADSVPDVAAAAPASATPPKGDVETAAVDPIAAAGAALDRADGQKAVGGSAAAATVAAAPLDDFDPTPRPGETKRAARKRVRLATKSAAMVETAAPTVDSDTTLAAPVPALEVAALPDAKKAANPGASVAPAGGGGVRVKIGIFSVEANAQRAVDKLKAGGVSADIRKEDVGGKTIWSVVANGDGASKAFLAKVKDLGFSDAYVVSG